MVSPANIPAYILCGGRSQRFGTDKARATIDGQPQIVKLATALSQTGHRVDYVADRVDRYNDLGITCLVDEYTDSGPMAGLSCALKHHAQQVQQSSLTHETATLTPLSRKDQPSVESLRARGWILLVSCDQARWDTTWFTALTAATRPASAAIIAAYYQDGWQPLPALAHIDLIDELEQRLLTQRRSLKDLLSDLDRYGQSVKVLTDLSPRAWSFNTRDELDKLRQP